MHEGGSEETVVFVFRPKDYDKYNYELDEKYVIIEFYDFHRTVIPIPLFGSTKSNYSFRWKQVVDPTVECPQN